MIYAYIWVYNIHNQKGLPMNCFLFLSLPLFICIQNVFAFKIESFLSSEKLGKVELFYEKNSFYIVQEEELYRVENYCVDKTLHQIEENKLAAFLKENYLSIHQDNEGNFAIKVHVRGLGGGPIGATVGAAVGKAGVSIVGHGLIVAIGGAVGTVATPAVGTAVGIGLESLFGGIIETASIAAGIACGIIGAVATGPV